MTRAGRLAIRAFAGAMQDLGLAVVVGEKTFGKASVQTLIPLPDGTAIRLTTSRYYTPNGRSLHEKGVQPDFVVPQGEEKGAADLQLDAARDAVRRIQNGEKIPSSAQA